MKTVSAAFVTILLSGCSWICEPNPAITFTPVQAEKVPAKVREAFQELHPDVKIEQVLLREFHSKHAGWRYYLFRFRGAAGRVETDAISERGKQLSDKAEPADSPWWR
ncbi:MAG: hypothetical protein V2A58_01145 [Planctomycetota bacterium]